MPSKLAEQRARRAKRTRTKLRANAKSKGRVRLSVCRSARHISVQLIDDQQQKTLASASTQDKSLNLTSTSSVDAAKAVGQSIAQKAKEAGVGKVIFDRGAWVYHGRIKALAEAAREQGMEF